MRIETAQLKNSFKYPFFQIISIILLSIIFGLLFHNFLITIPLILAALISSFITYYFNNIKINKLNKQVVELVNDGNNDIDIAKFNEDIRTSFEKAYSLSEKSTSEIGRIFESLDEISEPVNQQAEDLEIISNRINELSIYIDSIYSNFTTIMNSTDKINDLTSSGVSSINILQDKFNTTSKVFDEIFNSFQEFTTILNTINEFLETINKIGKKTNLLALNASIEATRAGSGGKGFIVVANQFKELSNQTEQYTSDIGKSLNNVSQQYYEINEKIQTLKSSINKQSGAVNETNNAFNNIASSIYSISEEINSVNISLDKMKDNKDEVFGFIEDTASLSQETAATSEEFASTIAYHIQTIADIFAAIKKTEELLLEYEAI